MKEVIDEIHIPRMTSLLTSLYLVGIRSPDRQSRKVGPWGLVEWSREINGMVKTISVEYLPISNYFCFIENSSEKTFTDSIPEVVGHLRRCLG